MAMLNIQPKSSSQMDCSEVEACSSNARLLSPQEEALQSLCKDLLKSRIFRGFYLERRFVNPLNNYRDIISLQRSEKELGKLLLDIKRRLELFYTHSSTPNMWIGLSNGPLFGVNLQAGALDTYIWVELDELAFGQYWFSIKSIRFRQKEIILKLKVLREVENESFFSTPLRTKKRVNPAGTETIEAKSTSQPIVRIKASETISNPSPNEITPIEQQITWQDFVEIMQYWGIAIKQSVYEFMAQDINKDNLKSLLRLLGLLMLTVVSGTIAGIKYLGIFTIRFMFELSRLTHVLTPIILKIIDVLSKVVGGFYILIAMVWRDTVGKKLVPTEARVNLREIDYNRPLYRSIQYDVQQQNQKKFE